jgi:hypothetical protein
MTIKPIKTERDYRKALRRSRSLERETEHLDGGSLGRTGHLGGGL